MNNESQPKLTGATSPATTVMRILLGLMLTVGTATSVRAQGQIASGTVSGSGSGPYTYVLSFKDAAGATSPIGSVWYAWVPGVFYLPGTPTSASAPAGWTATVSGNSVQYVANSAGNDITAGQTLSGFTYQAVFTPAQLAAAPNSGRSDAYSAGLFSDAGNIFVVTTVPEPSTLALFTCGATALWFGARRKPRVD
ncbi:MAG TPA: PEP-CTERM sorting domain-containing protein [Candidatus Acidoferrum sp.]|nr:PEP-CTERM sorting domain-containing protein [Candidatus Acidoferrum sp.]